MATNPAGTLADLADVLREYFWKNGRAAKLFQECSFYTSNLLTQTSSIEDTINGKYLKVPVMVSNGATAVAKAAGEKIKIGGGPKFAAALFTPKYLFGNTAIEGPAFDQAHKSGKVVDVIGDYMDGMRSAVQAQVARCVWGDGTGIIDGASTTSGSPVVTPHDPRTVRAGKVYPGMMVSIGVSGTLNSLLDSVKVLSVDFNAATFKVDANAGATSTVGFIIVPGNVDTDGTNVRELEGLQSALSTTPGTYGTIAESATPMWAPNRFDHTSAPTVTFDVFDKVLNRFSIRFGDAAPKYTTITTHGIARLTYNEFRDNIRYLDAGNVSEGRRTMEITNGDISFNMRSDAGCPLGRVYWLPLEDAIWATQQGDWTPFNGGQPQLEQGYDSDGDAAFSDVYWWGVFQYAALAMNRRDRSGVQFNLTDPGE